MTRGIQGEYRPPTNTELVDFVEAGASETGLSLPWGYAPSVFSAQLLANDFKKYLRSYGWYPQLEALDLADAALEIITRQSLMGKIRSFDEVLPLLDRSRSPGYPLNVKHATKGLALDNEMEWIRNCVYQVMTTGSVNSAFQVRPGYLIPYRHAYFQASGKGEMRTVDKLLNPDPNKRKTRTFLAGDLILQIVGLMLYSDQNDTFLGMAADKNWSAVGMSPWYGGWNQLANYLLDGKAPESALFVCEDVSHMEASVNDEFQTVEYRLRNQALVFGNFTVGCGPVSELVRGQWARNLMNWYFQMVTYSYVIDVFGWLMLVVGKNMSGQYNTLMDNTLTLIRVGLYRLVLSLFRELGRWPTLEETLTRYFATPAKKMGDDSIFAHRDWLEWTRARAGDLGFTIELECPVGLLFDAKFLNAGFHRAAMLWYMRPNFEKIRASILFNWKSRSWRLTYVKVCAYRMLVYPFQVYRAEADGMLDYILRVHAEDMRSEHSMDSRVTYAAALAARMPDRENEWLCSGMESYVAGWAVGKPVAMVAGIVGSFEFD